MFQSIRQKKRLREKPEIKIAPLIDMVFILLIFFIVTTSFVSETGVDIERPAASTGQEIDAQSVRLGISSSGEIYMTGQRIGLFTLRPILENKLRTQPETSVILIADKTASAELIVDVMDEVRSGVERIALGTENKNK